MHSIKQYVIYLSGYNYNTIRRDETGTRAFSPMKQIPDAIIWYSH